MPKPLVTIILATYNQKDFVAKALNSIFEQTYQNLEIIICDNGSIDGTKQIIKDIISTNQDILFLDYPENQNITIRHNQYIQLAKGEFISILFGDDYYLPSKIETQIKAFNKLDEGWGVVYGPTLIRNQSNGSLVEEPGLGKDGNVLSNLLKNWHDGGMMNCVVPMTRRECYEKYLNYEDIFTEGEGVFLRIAMDYKFFYIQEPLSVMTEHENNYGKSVISNIQNHDLVLNRLQVISTLSKNIKNLIRSHRSIGLFNAVWHCLRTNANSRIARSLFISAIKIYPLILIKPKVVFGLILMLLPSSILKIINNIINNALKTSPFTIVD